jgi:hypothetical protein
MHPTSAQRAIRPTTAQMLTMSGWSCTRAGGCISLCKEHRNEGQSEAPTCTPSERHPLVTLCRRHSTVWSARFKPTGDLVVLKSYNKLALKPRQLAGVEREIGLLSQLNSTK